MTPPADDGFYAQRRREMVEHQLRSRGITDPRVLDAMLRVPRHAFVPEQYLNEAYADHPIPIAAGQTISQPYIVASMLQALEIKPEDKVLEVGTGSGYLTALLAELAREVFSIERHEVLANNARRILADLGYANVTVIVGDGSLGYPPAAPYDVIVVSAAAFQLPPALTSQLAEGGRMIIPVGADDAQQLQLLRLENGKLRLAFREPCRFVPLIED